MEVTNEQKIVLLELLGYRMDIKWDRYRDITWHSINNFNPLDITILMKVLDKIEQIHKTITTIRFQYSAEHSKHNYGVTMTDTEHNGVMESAFIREEAILKAILAYLNV